MSQPADYGETIPNSEHPAQGPEAEMPRTHVGRYRIDRELGEGGFGRVFLAYDDQLNRPVAVKVAHPHRLAQPEMAATYLAEARILAQLDHAHIVPVYDAGQTEGGLPFVVSKFINGHDLARLIKQDRPAVPAAVSLVATLAEALHHAHLTGLVHRDIKPANILIDTEGKPYLADFGLALREDDYGKGSGFAGTPSYMSPEQARREGHRVDGRSDIFSLGVVFYELLAGRRPFRGPSREELLEQITTSEPRPLRQINETIPREVERICLKALAKRAADRYLTAKDFAEDLRHFLAGSTTGMKSAVIGETGIQAPLAALAATVPLTATPTPHPGLPSDGLPFHIIPKGLHSFDATDADFFLELLPGPRDRDGLPNSLRFWKMRIETRDADSTFAVGLMYGPSGCGKSSLVKAGLLPRLARTVVPVYVEATSEETEARLLRALRRQVPALPKTLDLIESLAAVRRGRYVETGQKVLLVLDQFEQWLHARRNESNTELVRALRQCDGGQLQCIVLVRDDFWLAVSRFMSDMEVEILEGRNSALVDLFDVMHARKVLAAFGRAYGKLELNLSQCTKEQNAFLDQAVEGLTQEGKVISVRLALFAEMVKGKPWTPATLKAVGGTEGVGVTFLEETFTASTAPPAHRMHQKAAQAVLRSLLPEMNSDIKGNMRSRQELLKASGYANQSKQFDSLLAILDGELRLITPTDPEGVESTMTSNGHAEAGEKYYQLTHDYLVHSLRNWLTRKQKETRRGRAELLLTDRAHIWNSRPANRQLPSLMQWTNILIWTRKKNWTPPQKKMMSTAGGYYIIRAIILLVLCCMLGYAIREYHGRQSATTLRDNLLSAAPRDVPNVVAAISPYRQWVHPLLRQGVAEAHASEDAGKQLRMRLALHAAEPGHAAYLFDRLFDVAPADFGMVQKALLPQKVLFTGELWTLLEDHKVDPDRRFRAACALAGFDAGDERWAHTSEEVVAKLVAENPLVLVHWKEVLSPIKHHLLPQLGEKLADGWRTADNRRMIAGLYRDLARDNTEALTTLVEQVAGNGGNGDDREGPIAQAKRRANIGAALVAMEQPERVWSFLKHSDDPTVRSYLIESIAQLAEPRSVIERLQQEKNAQRRDAEPELSIRRGLLLVLGSFHRERLSDEERTRLLPLVAGLYQDDPDSGIHSAAEWVLRRWKREEEITRINRDLPMGPRKGFRWFRNNEGQTLAILPKETEAWQGNPTVRRNERLGYTLAVGTKEVTIHEFLRWKKEHKYDEGIAPSQLCPVNQATFYDAAAYCNWLSEKEGIPPDQWCYERNKDGQYAEGMTIAADYRQRTGYRLPMEVEWETAAAAGAVTKWSCGMADNELLAEYAWYHENSFVDGVQKTSPVGTRKPNNLGLFDMQGNLYEWCQDHSIRFKPKGNSSEQPALVFSPVHDKVARMIRGGSCFERIAAVSVQEHGQSIPLAKFNVIGIRVVRTLR